MKYTCSKNITENFLEELLKSRGINDYNSYIKPTEYCLNDPSLLDNIDLAAKTLNNYISDPEKSVTLIIDCDQDGYTSAAMLYNYFYNLYGEDCNIKYKIHSGKQHGLEDMIEEIEKEGADLVIIPDAGSNDYDYHKRLFDLGIKVVVIDHHEAEKYSEHAIVVNNQLSSGYTNKHLSGAGVVYKVLEYIDKLIGKDNAKNYLDLAAIGIIGDMMSIAPLENRYIISKGLSNITNECIKEIINKQAFSIGNTDIITPTAVSFYIAPLINAIVRIGKDSEKEVLFESLINGRKMVPKISRNKVVPGQFESLAEQNARNCVNARSRQNRSLEKAIDQVEMNIIKNGLDENKIIIVEVEEDSIDTTLTGLLAMKIAADYKKPVIVARENSEGFLKGSARGIDKGELKNLRQFFLDSGYFEYAKGHPNAHGISIEKKLVDSFIRYSNDKLKDINFNEGVYDVDFILNQNSSILFDLIKELGDCQELYGKGCEEPLIVVEKIKINTKDIDIIGKNSDTLKFTINGITYIQFKANELIEDIKDKNDIELTVLGRANANKWMNYITPQIIIEDYDLRNAVFDF